MKMLAVAAAYLAVPQQRRCRRLQPPLDGITDRKIPSGLDFLLVRTKNDISQVKEER